MAAQKTASLKYSGSSPQSWTPEDVTAPEIAAAYHERWEYEIALREIETQMLESGSGLPLEISGTRPPGDMGTAARPLLHKIPDDRGRGIARASTLTGSHHPKHQRRAPPGQQPGGIFPRKAGNRDNCRH